MRAWLAAGLAGVLAACGAGGDDPGAIVADGPSLVIISIDTLRADGLSLYGGPDGVSPVLAEFARQAVVFEQARSASPHTAPSHMSLFTSLYPSVHGVQNVAHGEDPRTGERGAIIYTMAPGIRTLAQILTDAGFTCAAETEGGNLNLAHGFGRGFARYTKQHQGAARQVDDGIEALRQLTRLDGRYFLFWHTYQVHSPYVPPAPYVAAWAPDDYHGLLRPVVDGLAGLDDEQRWNRVGRTFWDRREDFGADEARYLRGLYEGGIAYTDHELGRLFAAMEPLGVFDDAIVVVLADHGEEFTEHEHWQHGQVFEECLAVPLMIRLPGGLGGGTRIATPVSLLDVMPTLLELLGVGYDDAGLAGRSLAEAVRAGTQPPVRPLVSELRWDRPGRGARDWLVAHRDGELKFIVDMYGSGNGALYNLESDPGERHDLAAEAPQLAERFAQRHEQWLSAVEEQAQVMQSVEDLDPELLEQLVELGYIDADADAGAGNGR